MAAQTSTIRELKNRLAKAESALEAIRDGQIDTILGDRETLVVRLAKSEARDAHIKRVLLAIRNTNELIVQVNDENQLIVKACSGLVETMGYQYAALAYMNGDGPVKIACAKTDDSDLPSQVTYHVHPHLQFQAWMGPVLTQSQPVLIDRTRQLGSCPWIPFHDHQAVMCRRLAFRDQVYGVFSVAIPITYKKDAEERDLFNQLADDLSFAFYKLEMEERQRQAEQDLFEHQENERKRIQEALDQTRAELVRKTRLATVGQVSASIGHDLRNPLGAVRNAAYLLRRYLTGTEDKILRQLNVIEYEINRSNQIITNLLNIAQTRPPEKTSFALDELIQQTLESMYVPESIEIDYDINPMPLRLEADHSQMQQVLHNLIANAIEAMGGEGCLIINAETDTAMVIIHLNDSGPGFSINTKEDPFEPLVTSKRTGTGLGLTICRDIITQHGGIITAGNSKCGGAEIRITLPHHT